MGRPSTEYPIVNGPSLKGMGVRVMVGEGVRVGVSVWVGVEDGVAEGMLVVVAVDKAMDEEGFRRKSKAGVRSRKMVINTQAVRKLILAPVVRVFLNEVKINEHITSVSLTLLLAHRRNILQSFLY